MRRFLLNIPALIALALLCALAAPTANAQDSPSRMESVDVFIDVQQNGDMLVQETFVYAFQRQGISFTGRSFRLESVDDVDQVSISMDGRDLPVETGRGERRIRLDWEHPPVNPPETHTFVLRYRVRGGLNFGEEQDSVMWEAIPGNRGENFYIGRGSVTVRVPRSVAGQQRIESLGGDADSLVLDVRTVKVTLLEGLPIGEYLAVSVFFPHGLVEDPNPPLEAGSFFVFPEDPPQQVVPRRGPGPCWGTFLGFPEDRFGRPVSRRGLDARHRLALLGAPVFRLWPSCPALPGLPHPQVPLARRRLPFSGRCYQAPQRPARAGGVHASQPEGRSPNLPVYPRGYAPEGQLEDHWPL